MSRRIRESILEERDGFDMNEVITEEDVRWYPHDPKTYVPSTTTVLDEIKNRELEYWIGLVGKEAANKVAYQAANEGSAVHDIAEELARQLILGSDAQISWLDEFGRKQFNVSVWKGVIRFVDFCNKHVKRFLFVEEKLTSTELFVGGRCDAILELNDGRIVLVDYKYSNALSATYSVQTWVYKKLVEECLGLEVDARANLWLKAKTRGEDKKGLVIQGEGYKLVEHTEDERDEIVFKAAHALFMDRYRKKEMLPEIHTYPAHLKIEKK